MAELIHHEDPTTSSLLLRRLLSSSSSIASLEIQDESTTFGLHTPYESGLKQKLRQKHKEQLFPKLSLL